MRRRPVLLAVGTLVVGITSVWVLSADNAPAGTTTSESASATATATVTRRTLQQTEEFDATVGYGEMFALPGSAIGTVTWVPEEGTTLEPGDALYKVDERPTYWAHGEVPMYRVLQRGSEGADVEQLQRFLQSEGYLAQDAEIDGEFGTAVRNAVKVWQKDNGLEESGQVDSSLLIFLPHDAVRVAGAPRLGEQASGGVLAVTPPDLFVSAEVSGSKKKIFEGSPTIEVELADGSRHAATVASISAVQSQDAFGEQKFRVMLELEAPTGQEPGEVNVNVIDVLAEGVLTVPVQALVALAEGGYAVEVAQPDGTTQYRAVEIGEFADGHVEIAGDVEDGDEVVVPS